MSTNKHIGSRVEDFFAELGELEAVQLLAAKKHIAEQLRAAMRARAVSQSTLAKRMATSRTVVNRLLDPADTGVTLATLASASSVLGMGLAVRLEAAAVKRPARPAAPRKKPRPARGTARPRG